jgi:hypothetical protein
MKPQEIESFIRAAVECSVFVAPLEPGLTHGEMLELGKRVELLEGELGDAILRVGLEFFPGTRRFQPDDRVTTLAWSSSLLQEPDYHDYDALDFVTTQFNAIIRSEGKNAAKIERATIVERAIANGFDRVAVEAEVTILILTQELIQQGDTLKSKYGLVVDPLPSVQRQKLRSRPRLPRPMLKLAFPLVKDVIERRVDGRPKHAEPFDAFAGALTTLGYPMFRLWWVQTVSELRQSEIHTLGTAISVLSAALVEGALTFVVKHARSRGLDVFKSKEFDGEARSWRVDDLVSSAARGGPRAILDQTLLGRTRRLIQLRQRIHAGRMLADYPGGPPDLRPDEAREAKLTAEQVVRAVLDWLEMNP